MKKMLIALLTLTAVAGNLFAGCNTCDDACVRPEMRKCEEFVRREVPAIPHKHVSYTYSCPTGCTPCGEIVSAELQ